MIRAYSMLFFSIFLTADPVFSQLNCKTTTAANQDKVKKCLHQIGKVSTVETWDKDRRQGSLQGFSVEGKELFNYDLRTFAGHASVYLNYYPNGQVQKAEYSSAPDGGIQFYRIIHYFDEQGKQTGKMDLSQPDGHPVLHFENDTSKYDRTKYVVTPAIPVQKPKFTTVFKIVNETTQTLKIELKSIVPSFKDTLITLKRGTELVVDSVLKENFIVYSPASQPKIVASKRKKKFKTILSIPTEMDKRRIYTLHVVEVTKD